VDSWKTVRIGHSCAAVSSYNSPPAGNRRAEANQPIKLVKAEEKVLSFRKSVNLESEYLATGFSLRTVLNVCEKASSQKMKGERNEKRNRE
jgi:hypothetical protein